MATVPMRAPAVRSNFGVKHILWAIFGLMVLFVLYHDETPFLDKQSPIWLHFAKVKWLLIPHGVAGGLALLLAPLQFSTRLRQRFLQAHRVIGRIYVGSVVISGPVAVYIAHIQGPPELVMAAVVQASGWLFCTGVALYCVRNGKIQQHREWMVRSYPFAMVFVVTRVLFAVPVIDRMGLTGVISVVWSCEAAACFLPSMFLAMRDVLPKKVPARVAVAR